MVDVGRRISQIREALGWKAAHLARLARIHRTELHHLENGAKPKVTAAVMWRVVEALAAGRRESPGVLYEEIWTGRKPEPAPGSLLAVQARLEDAEHVLMTLVERAAESRTSSDASTPSPGARGRPGPRRGGSSRRSS